MPKFYSTKHITSLVNEPLDHLVEVQITLGKDPVFLYCTQDIAETIIDARKVEEAIERTMPRIQEYNARFALFYHRLSELWPLRSAPSWTELMRIFNDSGMVTINGTRWQRPNLIQKMEAMGLSKDNITNPNGVPGRLFAVVNIDKEVESAKEFLDDATSDQRNSSGIVYPDMPVESFKPKEGPLFSDDDEELF